MAYQRVYPVQELIKVTNSDGELFAGKKELTALLQKGREYNLVYFSRQNEYVTVNDIPHKCSETKILSRSLVQGPLETKPPEDYDDGLNYDYDEPLQKTLFRCIPIDEMPEEFVPIEYREYGLIQKGDFRHHLLRHYPAFSFNYELIKHVGREALQKLQQWGISVSNGNDEEDETREADDEDAPLWHAYSKQLENTLNTLVSFEYAERKPYPTLYLKVWGARDQTIKVLQRLNLPSLTRAFDSATSRQLGLENVLKQGFSYDLPLEEVDLEALEEEERVIL